MSTGIAQANKAHFKVMLKNKLSEELLPQVCEVKSRTVQKGFVDSYGRVTYYYVKLGDKNIPVYQPGTIMFECGVVKESDLNVTAHGSQQNGAILGNGCAIFLCKFLCRLVNCYNSLAEVA